MSKKRIALAVAGGVFGAGVLTTLFFWQSLTGPVREFANVASGLCYAGLLACVVLALLDRRVTKT